MITLGIWNIIWGRCEVRTVAKATAWTISEMAKKKSVREKVDDKAPPAPEERPWMKYVGTFENSDSESSQSIDDVVYGATA
jgi:hypothetical protein